MNIIWEKVPTVGRSCIGEDLDSAWMAWSAAAEQEILTEAGGLCLAVLFRALVDARFVSGMCGWVAGLSLVCRGLSRLTWWMLLPCPTFSSLCWVFLRQGWVCDGCTL